MQWETRMTTVCDAGVYEQGVWLLRVSATLFLAAVISSTGLNKVSVEKPTEVTKINAEELAEAQVVQPVAEATANVPPEAPKAPEAPQIPAADSPPVQPGAALVRRQRAPTHTDNDNRVVRSGTTLMHHRVSAQTDARNQVVQSGTALVHRRRAGAQTGTVARVVQSGTALVHHQRAPGQRQATTPTIAGGHTLQRTPSATSATETATPTAFVRAPSVRGRGVDSGARVLRMDQKKLKTVRFTL